MSKQPIKRLECIHKCNAFMGGLNRSDQMVKYVAGMTTDKVVGKNICPCAQSHRFECVCLVQFSPSSPNRYTVCGPLLRVVLLVTSCRRTFVVANERAGGG